MKAVRSGKGGVMAAPPTGTNANFYVDDNPLEEVAFERKIKLLEDVDAYARAKDPRVRQVSCSLSGSWQAVQILRADGQRVADIRPLVRLNVSITAGEGDRQDSGNHGAGGRTGYAAYLETDHWQAAVDEALRQALVNLESVPAPAGEMTVVLGPAGREFCCTKRSATDWRVISIAKRPRCSLA